METHNLTDELAQTQAERRTLRNQCVAQAEEIERLRSALLEIQAGEEMTGADAMVIATRALQ